MNETIADGIARIKRELEKLDKTIVRIALFGQPGAGKSTLINTIVGREEAKSGVGTDTTVTEQRVEHNGLHFFDLPGYDTKRFPKEAYFAQFDIPTFDLFLCVFDGRFHAADTTFFRELKRLNKVCVFVRNKVDTLWQPGRETSALFAEIGADARRQVDDPNIDVRFISCRTKEGVDDLEKEITRNLDGAKRERWLRTSKGYSTEFLKLKYEACEKSVALYAGLAAANALNPIPGLDVAVDVATLLKLLHVVRSAYGLDDARLVAAQAVIPAVKPLADKLLGYGTKAGLIQLLKLFGSRSVLKQFAKYIPVIGQGIAALASYTLTTQAGTAMLDLCHELASKLVEAQLAGKA